MFWMFGAFIIGCGTTHLMEVVTSYTPVYRLSGILKLLTAGVSVATAVAIVPLIPQALSLRSPKELECEVSEGKRAHREVDRKADELATKNEQLIRAERLKSDFLANVSHELRTPLTLILAPLESWLGGEFGPITESQQGNLQTIHNNAVRLLQMVTGLLDFSKVESGKVAVNREAVEIVSLTRTVLVDFQPLIQHKGLESSFQPSPAEAWVHMDRYLYERILFNLFSNAVKFTPAGGRFAVLLECQAERLRLSVTDSGIGIATADLQGLFQKFHQLEGSSTRRFEGTGLGLALVKEFAQLLGGTVSVQSTVGQGSTFTVECHAPACAAATTDPGTASPPTSRLIQKYEPGPSEEQGSAAAIPPNAPEVLIAEDNAELASYIGTLLHGTYRIRIVGDGEEALEQVRQQPPELLLADVMMPHRDGLSLCREVKSDPATAQIPVVLLTALTNRDSLLQGWEACADDYLFKPFHPRELSTRIRSILSATQLGKQMRLIIDTAYDAFVLIDSAGRIIEWNPQAEDIFGWSRQEAVGRELATTIIPAAHREAHYQGLQRFRATGEGPVLNQRLQLSALHRNGHEFPVELTISVIPGWPNYLFGAFVHDITERRRAEEKIRKHTNQLEMVNKELETFCYAVSHDLRAPLRGIDGFSQALLEDYGKHLDAQGADYLRRVRAASQRMGQLIDSLLKLSRLGRGELRREAVDLSALAQAVADELRQHQPQRQVTFVIAQVGVVQGDAQVLRIVLDNLLGNAWKFTGKHPQARIEFGVDKINGQLAYFVRDDGVGFDMAYSAKLFGAFQRLHGEQDFPGTGIGLATVQRIIHRHGGVIWAEATVEQGATFYFTLGSVGETAHA